MIETKMRLGVVAAAVCAALSWGLSAFAGGATESEVKAAFLFNFARYVEWPADSFRSDTSPITIGVVGDDAFPPVLQSVVSGKLINKRSVEVKRFASADQATGAHILFIGASQAGSSHDISRDLGGTTVFTVADFKNFAKRGGMANFVLNDKKVRFEINEGVAKGAGLKISSRLLRLATLVN